MGVGVGVGARRVRLSNRVYRNLEEAPRSWSPSHRHEFCWHRQAQKPKPSNLKLLLEENQKLRIENENLRMRLEKRVRS